MRRIAMVKRTSEGDVVMHLLDAAQAVANENLEANIKTQVKDLIRGYRHFWDPFGELLQNAVDSINRRFRVCNDPDFYLYKRWKEQYGTAPEPGYSGKITIEVWPETRTLRILDNGVGIHGHNLLKFLLPEGSDKKKGKEYGYKGKGLTYAAFISTTFAIKSRFFLSEETYEVALDGLLNWCEDEDGTVPFPNGPKGEVSPASDPIPDGFNTEVMISLADDYDLRIPAVSSLNQAFDLLSSKEHLSGFEVVLRTKTAVGNTRPLFNQAPIVPIDVQLIVHYGQEEPVVREVKYSYFHPKESNEIKMLSWSFDRYVTELRPQAGFDGRFRCLYFTALDATVGERAPLQCDFLFSAISTSRLTNISENLKLTRPGVSEAALTYGVHLSINGMPTGIRVDDWEERGQELKRYHVVVDVDLNIADELDPGRKGISATRAKQISEAARGLRHKQVPGYADRFSAYAGKYLDWGPTFALTEETDFEIRVEEAMAQEKKDEAENNELLAKVQSWSSLEHLPTSEEEVRVLFHELLAKGLIKGYRTVYAAGSRALYDSAFSYELALDREENLHPQDPLGFSSSQAHDLRNKGHKSYVHSTFYNRFKMNHPQLCGEFKPTLDAFIREIASPARSSKSAKDIDLLIAWSSDISPGMENYTLTPIPGEQRFLHSTTHRLSITTPESTDLLCIVLKDVLELL